MTTHDNGDPTTYSTILVSPDDLDTVVNHNGIIIVTGSQGDERVTFAGEFRSMDELLSAVVESGEPKVALVADWQIQAVELADEVTG